MPEKDPYTTERKEEFRKLTKDGGVETWYRIYATSRGGTYYHIEVQEAQLDKAPQLLVAKAKQLDSI